jgi:predicted ester cyclase
MSIESNKAVVRQLFEEVVAKQQFQLLERLIAHDVVDHNARTRGWGSGPEGVQTHARFLAQVFPDFQLTVDDLVAEGDRVIVFWHFVGTQRGALWGVPPTGRRVQAHTISLVRVVNDRVTEYEARPDRLSLLLQLGSLGEYRQQLDAVSAGSAP